MTSPVFDDWFSDRPMKLARFESFKMGSNVLIMMCGGLTSVPAVNDTLSRLTLRSETSSCITQSFLSEFTLT